MKKYFGNFKIVLLFAAMLALMAFTPQVFPSSGDPPNNNPLAWCDGNFPSTLYLIDKADNPWYMKGDSIYSAFKINDEYYASGVKWSKSSMGFAMAFANVHGMPVKVGFGTDEQVYWGVCRKGVIYQLSLQSTYPGKYDTNAVFEITDIVLAVQDNPYYSLNPLWTDVTDFKIKPPIAGKWIYFRDVLAYKPMTPKYVEGSCKLEICEGTATIKYGKMFNETKIKFTTADIERGYICVVIRAVPLKNSTSTKTYQEFKLYWQA